MHYPDLATECQIAAGPRVRAVGWLAAGHEFTRGTVDPRVVEVLAQLAEEGWVHVAAAGSHQCELCRDARDSRNILVPGKDVLYVVPAMIGHYMTAHEYLPPAEFCEAVVACPAPTTDAYFAELARFLEVFAGPTAISRADFDRSARRHREWRAELAASRAAEAKRKPFTW